MTQLDKDQQLEAIRAEKAKGLSNAAVARKLKIPTSTVRTLLIEKKNCRCRHDLGAHIPDPQMPFAWPCSICKCREYNDGTPSKVTFTDSRPA